MPVTIKSAFIKYKDGQGQYVGIDSVAETTTAEQVAAIEAKGEEVLESIPADYSTLAAAVGGKADKVSSAASGNFAGLDANGNLVDSGHKHSDYLTAHQDISGKADKVSSATNGNFAALNGSGNLTDSGHKHSDYQPAVVVETVSGSTPSITGADNHRYVCGTVSSISITPPSTGIIDVIFTSGTTPAVLSGVSGVNFPGWFNPSSLSASTVYEINIMDGQHGAVMAWT